MQIRQFFTWLRLRVQAVMHQSKTGPGATGSLLLMSLLVMANGPVQAEGATEYKLGSGDVIQISVFGEKELSFEQLRLTDAGTFSYPFIGEVRARGKTATEIANFIADKLEGDYLIDPRVSVSVLQYRDFFISGEVKKPGGYPYQPGLTLRRAVALAGGLTERASENRISIIRDMDPNKTPEQASLASMVLPGDSITIGQGFF